MSYKVLARQWRPTRFAEVTGQDYAVKVLTNAIKSQRLHHAYLFTGTRGVGKTTLARILAKSLNCLENQAQNNPEPCGECVNCTAINQGSFVDLIEVDAASKTKVEDTRDLLERVHYMPTQGRYKVYLIDEVHMLSNHSFNSLLKTLEEPPAYVKFLLATTDPQKIPPTVSSRCLQLNLKPIADKTIAHYLEQVLSEEQIEFEQPALLAIAKQAAGSIRDALSLTDQSIAFTDGKITLEQIHAMLGVVGYQAVLDLLHHLVAQDARAALDHIRLISQQTVDLLSVLNQLLELLQQVALIQQVPDPKLCQDSMYKYEVLQELGQKLGPETCQLFYQIGLMGKKDWHIANNTRSHFEMIILRMLAFEPYKGEAPQGRNRSHNKVGAPNTVSQPQVEPESQSQSSVQPVQSTVSRVDPIDEASEVKTEVQDTGITQTNWSEAIKAIKVSAFAASLIKQAQWLKQVEDTIFLQLSVGHYALWEEGYGQEIERALSERSGKPVKLQISEQKKDEQKLDEQKEKTKPVDKHLNTLLKTFDGELVT